MIDLEREDVNWLAKVIQHKSVGVEDPHLIDGELINHLPYRCEAFGSHTQGLDITAGLDDNDSDGVRTDINLTNRILHIPACLHLWPYAALTQGSRSLHVDSLDWSQFC